jgi:6-phosphofructokinase 1
MIPTIETLGDCCFPSAFAEAVKAVSCAHVEAICAIDGIGLVKLMGRESGFIACYATLTSQCVNFCLVPEVPFELQGSGGLLEALQDRLARREHAVLVVAESAGQQQKRLTLGQPALSKLPGLMRMTKHE